MISLSLWIGERGSGGRTTPCHDPLIGCVFLKPPAARGEREHVQAALFTIIRAARVFLGSRGDRSSGETHFSIMLSIVWWWWRLPPLVAAKGDMLSISLGSRSRTHNTLQFVERSSRTEMVHGRLSSLPLSLPFFPGWPWQRRSRYCELRSLPQPPRQLQRRTDQPGLRNSGKSL